MGGNNFVYTQFQRRRRRSNPPSPTSPTFTRRPAADRQEGHLHVSIPADVVSASTTNSESPAIDINVPSPTFDLSPFSLTSTTKDVLIVNPTRPARSSDEYGQYRRSPVTEPARPATSAATAPMATKLYQATAASSPATSPANQSSMRPSFEHLGNGTYPQEWRSRFYDQQGPATRNFSISSVGIDRSMVDDFSSTKNAAPKKSRFHLLHNSMNLFNRRNPTQPGKYGDGGLTINTSIDNVSIRGTRFHDFNAPKPWRVYSHNDASSGENSPHIESRPSMQDHRRSSDLPILPISPGHRASQSPKHSPIFREHFNDDGPVLQPAQTSYLHSLAISQNVQSDAIPSNMPAFAKRLPPRIPDDDLDQVSGKSKGKRSERKIRLETAPTAHAATKQDAQPSPPPPPIAPPSPDLSLPLFSQLPKHMTSTSSRFSFQIAGHGSSAQERLLEEKHKQHEASKKLAKINGEDEEDEDDFGDYDVDEEGFEERIPGVNADADDYDDDFEEPIPFSGLEEETQPSILNRSLEIRTANPNGFDMFHFTPETAMFTPTHPLSSSLLTPLDDKGHRIGVADTKDSPGIFQPVQNSQCRAWADPSLDGLGISTVRSSVECTSEISVPPRPENTASFDDDDLYFDDGDFDEMLQDDHNDFDEDIFDDETGKIHDIPAHNAERFAAAERVHRITASMPLEQDLSQSEEEPRVRQQEEPSDEAEGSQQISVLSTAARSFARVSAGAHNSLTEGNLATYHDALVTAANEAAAKGRFTRGVSFTDISEDQSSQSQLDEGQQCLTSDESRISRNLEPSRIAEDDGFPFDDDAYDDDLMIAEANAEVLENDDEGFYGNEFGFYARAKGKGSSGLTNGGYFGPRGANGIKRSHSAKNNFQEPSLTPITEQTEYSTRNSVAGMAQQLDFEPESYEDPEMSFSALAKLRGRAFGSSSTSINSMGASPPGSSPLAHLSHHRLPSIDTNHGLGPSIRSLTASVGILESEEEDDDQIELPTLTQSTPRKRRSDPSPVTPQNFATMSPLLGASERSKFSHSRTSSGAESVSYVRDPDGSNRWLLERRRTGDNGEPEVVVREYLAGARI